MANGKAFCRQTDKKILKEKQAVAFSHNFVHPFQRQTSIFQTQLFCHLQKLSIWKILKLCHLLVYKYLLGVCQ